MGLVVDEVTLTGAGISISQHPFRVDVEQEGHLQVEVSETALASFLEARAPAGLRRFHIRAADGKLFIEAVKRVLVDLKLKAVCTLEIVDGRQVFVRLASVDVAGADVRNLIQTQLDGINPVIDVSMFPFKAALDRAVAVNDRVTLTGRIVP